MRRIGKHGVSAFLLCLVVPAAGAAPLGYYRQPSIRGDVIVFVAEGDLWKVPVGGGMAARLTSHPGDESRPAVSPDGQEVAFTAQYEGPTEIYTMPISGGQPRRRTFDAARIGFVGWTPDGRVMFATDVYSTLPSTQLVILDRGGADDAGKRTRVPLAQAADGEYDGAGKTLYFTRLPFQGSHTKRYKGGTAQNLWKFETGAAEAVALTADYAGTSKSPMWWKDRVYFASDRDGTMNLWSMKPDGTDPKQHTRHVGWDVASPSLSNGRIAYQLGADLHVYDIAADADRSVPISLDSDFDQTRERWVAKPMDYASAIHVSADGSHVAITARGRVFVAPHRQGRFVEATRKEGVRYRDARFMPDGKSVLAMSDESGEVEFWTLPANGVGESTQLTRDGQVLRWEGVPSPDGKLIAHHDKNQRLFLYDLSRQESRKIDESRIGDFGDLAWSPDSAWLAYVAPADNLFRQIRICRVADGTTTNVTTDRFDSYSPAWSADGKWLYLLSDRNLKTIVPSPWGNYQPEPFLDKTTLIYQVALTPGLRSPFAPKDELHDKEEEKKEPATQPASAPATPAQSQPASRPAMPELPIKPEMPPRRAESTPAPTGAATSSAPAGADGDKTASAASKPADVKIEREGIASRIIQVPIPPGNYGGLSVNDKALFWMSSPTGERKQSLVSAAMANENVEIKPVVEDIRSYELSRDGRKLLIRKGDSLYIVDAAASKAELDKKDVNLSGWSLSVVPQEEWRQMFREAWRLERDYFYDRGMHGVDWKAMLEKYRPLVDRVASRADLSDLLAQMVSELSALHIFVGGGDMRTGSDHVMPASLGALLVRDETASGYRVEHIYRTDPDEPQETSPLARPGVDVKEGDLIELINGAPALSVPDIGMLLRHQAGQQVLLHVRPGGGGQARDVIVRPVSVGDAADLRYDEWEYTRREIVEQQGRGDIGYVHLRAMGGDNFTEWAKGYFPVFNRKGLIIDVRHNRGGNIDSWILGRLLRKAWFYWSQRVGQSPNWNMQYAFRGHVAVLCNEFTASDGEAFTEGIKRLNLGKVFGTRTWGGEIWLTSSNSLVDRGIATAAEFGVFGPEGTWLIEGHGVEPDVVVDNLPHATYLGQDAQLKAAIEYLQQQIKEKPIAMPEAPVHPDKSLRPRTRP